MLQRFTFVVAAFAAYGVTVCSSLSLYNGDWGFLSRDGEPAPLFVSVAYGEPHQQRTQYI